MSITEIATILTIIAGIIAIYGLFFGNKPLLEIGEKLWDRFSKKKKHREDMPKGMIPEIPDKSDNPTQKVVEMKIRGMIRFNKYVEDIKNLVSSSQYEQAVIDAQKAKDEITTIGNLDIPEVQLILGELDVWYAHALMYTGETLDALKILQSTDIALYNKRHEYKDDALKRWYLVLGRAHNHIGYIHWMDLGHYEFALSEFHKALSYFLDSHLEEELATAYDNLGRVYAQLGYETRSMSLIEHGRQLRQKLSSPYRLALSLNSQAIAFLNFGQSSHALRVNEQALKIFNEQLEKMGTRGKGLALLTKAHTLRQISKTKYMQDVDGLKMLDEVIQILREADQIFIKVGEDVRRFQVNNELGCVYREKAIILRQQHDTESALRQARTGIDYLEESVKIAQGNGKAIQHRIHYIDACEDLAQTYLVMGNTRKANLWIEKAEETIPHIYKFAENAEPEQISADRCFEEFWQQLGKTSWLRGQVKSQASSSSSECIEALILAAAYFGRFLERPLDQDNRCLYSPYRPLLAHHRRFIEYIYDIAKDWEMKDVKRIQDTLLLDIKWRYGMKSIWTEELFDEPLSFVLQMNLSNTMQLRSQ